jgi:hypothetical protein
MLKVGDLVYQRNFNDDLYELIISEQDEDGLFTVYLMTDANNYSVKSYVYPNDCILISKGFND